MEAPPVIQDPSKLPIYGFFSLELLTREQELEMEENDKKEGRHLSGYVYYLVRFTIPVNMDIIQRDFAKMFTQYGRLSDFKKRPVKTELESMEAVRFYREEQKVMVRVRFSEPDLYGLLIRKNDTLIFETVDDY